MFIAVSGNIGAGKSTLVRKLAIHYEIQPIFEAASQNPYLGDFYHDMKRWAFPLQISFLSHRFKQGLSIPNTSTGVVLDRTIYEDADIFAKNLCQSGYLSERDYQSYLFLYQTMVALIPAPQLLIYLKGSTEILTERIKQRYLEKKNCRNSEEFIPIDYLNNLNNHYNQWIENFNRCHVITVNIEQMDLKNPIMFGQLTERIDSFFK